MREVLNVIASIERIAKINGNDSMDVQDLDGVDLAFDWQNRAPKRVRMAGGR
jgi:hypothetical protein